jgi:hypothetical protein
MTEPISLKHFHKSLVLEVEVPVTRELSEVAHHAGVGHLEQSRRRYRGHDLAGA